MCPAGAVVASWSLTQEVAGLCRFTVMTNILVTELAFMENSIEVPNEWRSIVFSLFCIRFI